MQWTARLLVAASGAILISLALIYGRAAFTVAPVNLPLSALIGIYSAALLAVGVWLALGRAGRLTLGLAVGLAAIPLVTMVVIRLLAIDDLDVSLPMWLLPAAAVASSFLALLVTRRAPLAG